MAEGPNHGRDAAGPRRLAVLRAPKSKAHLLKQSEPPLLLLLLG